MFGDEMPPHVADLVKELGPEFMFPEHKVRYANFDSCSSDDPTPEEQEAINQKNAPPLLTRFCQKQSLLHEFVAVNKVDRITKQLDKGIGVNTPDSLGETPLFWANSAEVVDYLVDEGADVEWKNAISGCSVLYKFASSGRAVPLKALAKYLKKKGTLKASLNEGAELTGRTPLHCAALNGYTEVIKELLALGADKSIKDKYKKTPLELATKNGHADIVALLE
mmetsp:Transcript_72432/g.125573  ORF Transcript_72432/g.125573 Transcript_72432/m.125573 type:complete len:223 (-) Transcript_72432:75-743(-)